MSRVFENPREGLNYDVYGGAVPNSHLMHIEMETILRIVMSRDKHREVHGSGKLRHSPML